MKIKLASDDLKTLFLHGRVKCKYDGELHAGLSYLVKGTDIRVLVKAIDVEGVLFVECHDKCKSTTRTRSAALKKATIKSRRDEGAFIGRASKFKVGEEVAVCEMYSYVCNVLKRTEGDASVDAYKRKVAEAYEIEVSRVMGLAGWFNRTYVKPELMPRRVEIVSATYVDVQDIDDETWHAMGVDWVNEDFKVLNKRNYAGNATWDSNKQVVVYRYKTLSGSVQCERDLLTFEDCRRGVSEDCRRMVYGE